MILGLGNDLIEVTRVEKAAREERFLARTFTEKERWQLRGNMAFLTGCFAVKGAAVKYFGTGLRGIELVEIEALCNALEKPYVRLSGATVTYCAALSGLIPLVSISNTKMHAMVVAVLERGDRGGTE